MRGIGKSFMGLTGNKKRILKAVIGAVIVLVNAYILYSIAQQIPGHVVISELYIDAYNDTGSEWIELYNPTNRPVNISGWILNISDGTNIVLPVGSIISPHGFFLITDTGWDTFKDNKSWPSADYQASMDLNDVEGWVILKNSAGHAVDTVGWGSNPAHYEGSPVNPPPAENHSIERDDLVIDGYVYIAGSGYVYTSGYGYGGGWGPCKDTDNNAADFIEKDEPTPMNSGREMYPAPVYPVVGKPNVKVGEDAYFVNSSTPIYLNISRIIAGNWTLHWRIWYNGAYIAWQNVTINASSPNITIHLTEECVHILQYYVNNSQDNRYPAEGWHNITFYVDNTPPKATKEYGNPVLINETGARFITKDTPIYINATDNASIIKYHEIPMPWPF